MLKEQLESRNTVCETVLELLSLLSNKARFRIVCLLREGDYCVSDITTVVDQGGASNISQQLKILTLAGIVARRREGKTVLYGLKDDRVRKLLRFLEKTYMEADAS